MKYIVLFFLLLILNSCTFFETQKISSDTFYEEEIKTINWNDVDTYPVFKLCASISEKEAGKQCFIKSLTAEILKTLQKQNLIVHHEINEQVLVTFEVSEKGLLAIDTLEIDSLTTLKFPNLGLWITESITAMDAPLPALKRGIPVKTTFTLPVVLKTTD